MRTRVDEPIGAARHAHATPGAFVGLEGQTGPAERDAVRLDQRPACPVPLQHAVRPLGQRWEAPGRGQEREQFGQIVLVAGEGHFPQGNPVVWLQVGHRNGPAVEGRPGEGHDLGAPDVREPAVGTRDHRPIGRVERVDPAQLPHVTEGKIRAVGAFLRQIPSWARYWLKSDALEVRRGPRLLRPGGEPTQRRLQIWLQGRADVDYCHLVGGILGQGQGDARRGRTRPDDQRGRHGGRTLQTLPGGRETLALRGRSGHSQVTLSNWPEIVIWWDQITCPIRDVMLYLYRALLVIIYLAGTGQLRCPLGEIGHQSR